MAGVFDSLKAAINANIVPDQEYFLQVRKHVGHSVARQLAAKLNFSRFLC